MPEVPKSIERRLYKGLLRAFRRMIDDIQHGSGSLSDISSNARKLMNSEPVDLYLQQQISSMVKAERVVSARSWKEAARKSGNGRTLYQLMKNEMNGPVGTKIWELIAENKAFIKTLPEKWAEYVTQYTLRETLKGRRPEDVEAELRGILPGHITSNLKCVVRTECAKANAAIVQTRAEHCGIKAYIWRCVKDERSRDSHIGMDGVLVLYNDPPSPEALFPGNGRAYGKYHAGNTFNCRCYQEPVVDNAFLPDVFKMYADGEIFSITRAKFLANYGN